MRFRFFALLPFVSLVACSVSSVDEGSAASPTTPAAETAPNAEDIPIASFCSTREVDVALFDALAPEPAAQYVALRRNGGTIPGGLTKDLSTVAEHGALCGGAADAASCQDHYAKLDPPVRADAHVCFTRGDDVGCLESKADALAFLGVVHSVEEAFFIAQYDGYYANCAYADVRARGEKLPDGSFRIVAQKGGGCSKYQRAIVDVSRDGTLKELEAKDTDITLGCP